jgi:hypothetical protein
MGKFDPGSPQRVQPDKLSPMNVSSGRRNKVLETRILAEQNLMQVVARKPPEPSDTMLGKASISEQAKLG